MRTQTDIQTKPYLPAVYVVDPDGPVDAGRMPTTAGGPLQPVEPGPTNQQLWDLWVHARDQWLAAKQRKTGSIATLRAYTYAWTDLFLHFLPEQYPNVGPWAAGKTHVIAYQRHLENTVIGTGRNAGQPLSPATINARLAAISSYYTYCTTQYTIYRNEREIPLATHNPAKAVERAKTTPYEKSHALGPGQIRDLLNTINTGCLRGARDHALILSYIYTGRRAAEIVNLTWGDLTTDRGRLAYHWRGKGGKSRTDELPPPVYNAILHYLTHAGRLDDIQPTDHIWTALSTNAARLPNVTASYDPTARPISTGMVNRIVKTRARRAGIDPKQVHTHTLRHTAAMLRRQAGDDIQALQQFLNHSNLAVTQIYIQHRETRRDHSWSLVEKILQSDAP